MPPERHPVVEGLRIFEILSEAIELILEIALGGL